MTRRLAIISVEHALAGHALAQYTLELVEKLADEVLGNASVPGDLISQKRVVLWIRSGMPVRAAMERRDRWRVQLGEWQRKWQSRVSRRPQRDAHHDSWGIREKYVRCTASYPCREFEFIRFGEMVRARLGVRDRYGAYREVSS